MPNIAISATGLLRDFSDAGVLGLADVHLARTLATLGGDETQQVALAVALTMRAWRTGSPCLDIRRADALGADADDETTPDVAGLAWPQPDAWLAQLQASPLVGTAHDQRPLCLDGHLLYLRRTWQDQATVVSSLGQRWRAAAPVPPVGPTGDAVVDAVLSQWTYVLTGGPGTGKTTAVARVVDHVRQLPGLGRIAIAAPTGKAAARLAQALTQSSLQPTTVHRLLGARGPGRGFRHDANNPLPADLVIVDELSMVSLPLMAALLDALRPTARLLLVGDPGQLASVEAGAVLADLVAANVTASAHGDAPLVGHLTHVYRHRGALADLSIAAGSGDVDAAMAVLRRGDATATLIDADAHNLTWDDLPQVAGDIKTTAAQVRQAAEAGNAALALSSLDGHRLLCAHRQGPYGVATWARRAAELTTPPGRRSDDWWPGRAVLATATAPDIGVVSGAQGVVVEGPGQVRLAFDSSPNDADTTATPQLLPTDAVPGLATLDAMTVHKSQGSEFASVTVVVPPTESPLLI
ncbi:MAG: exodeoxyribonuclease V subunit alpha, partial [Propionibacteriaceae bacterium]|nr:exodeoxyribonuclease V subunit alpha [Propionibacteriaceae bacterium]